MTTYEHRRRRCEGCNCCCLCDDCQRDEAERIADCEAFAAQPLRVRVAELVRHRCWIDALYEIGVPERLAVAIGRMLPRRAAKKRSAKR